MDDPVMVASLAAWCFLVAVAGGLAGMVLGNIRLPLVLLLAVSPAAAGGANIAISGISAAAASMAHIRAGRVNWGLFAWMAPPSVVGALAGGYLAGLIEQRLLLLVIAAVLLYSGVDLLRWERGGGRDAAAAEPARDLDLRAAVVSGLVIGVLGGIVGLILGTLRVPALLRLVGESAGRAVATSLAIGVLVGLAGLLGHLPTAPPDLAVVAVGGAASIPGALLGARLTGRLSERQLIHAIGAILIVAALAAAAAAIR